MFLFLLLVLLVYVLLSDSDRILSSLADNLFLLTVRFSFLYNLYSVFLLITWDYAKKTAVLLCLYGMFSRIVLLQGAQLCCLPKACAKVQQLFKIQNFFKRKFLIFLNTI